MKGIKPDSPKIKIGSAPKFFEFKQFKEFQSKVPHSYSIKSQSIDFNRGGTKFSKDRRFKYQREDEKREN